MSPIAQLPDPVFAAERLLRRGAVMAPPVNLSKLVSLWPNLFIAEEDLDGAGYLLPIGELGGEILVKKSDQEERKRFTIAHELGHWVLGITLKKKTGHFSQPKNARYAEIEKWCDAFATNLLMPQAMIKASVSRSDPVLVIDSLTRAASKFKVSEEAFFIRVWEVLRLQVVLLSTEPGRAVIHIERSFADRQAEIAVSNAFKKPELVDQLRMSSIIHFSWSIASGKVKCFGRRLTDGRIFLVLSWPLDVMV